MSIIAPPMHKIVCTQCHWLALPRDLLVWSSFVEGHWTVRYTCWRCRRVAQVKRSTLEGRHDA